MAGLATARVLADRFASVTVLDRDELPTEATARRGVPQGRHAHALLAGGERVLESLFPGLVAELVAAGAQRGRLKLTRSGRVFARGAARVSRGRMVVRMRPLRRIRSGRYRLSLVTVDRDGTRTVVTQAVRVQ
jgi:2-polyprenyl-6-methoxyphenol hydroxylase-like FAD-dependent oxidoreductase